MRNRPRGARAGAVVRTAAAVCGPPAGPRVVRRRSDGAAGPAGGTSGQAVSAVQRCSRPTSEFSASMLWVAPRTYPPEIRLATFR